MGNSFNYRQDSLRRILLSNKGLQKQIKRLVKLHPNWQLREYIEYFLKISEDVLQPNAERKIVHLYIAIRLEKACDRVIKDFAINFPTLRGDSGFLYERCYDIKNELLYDVKKLRKVLGNYRAERANPAKVETYFAGVLKHKLWETFEVESPWHLLCNFDLSTQKKKNNAQQKIKKALTKSGVIEPYLSRYIFAWQYFVPVYKNQNIYNTHRKTAKWPNPNPLDFEEAARDYNGNLLQSYTPLEVFSSPKVSAETIEAWMNEIIKALQLSWRLKFDAIARDLESEQFNSDDDSNNQSWKWLDYEENEKELQDFVDSALNENLQKINKNSNNIRSKIPLKKRNAVMPLCYPHELSILDQEQFANKINVNQATISRYISKHYQTPLFKRIDDLVVEKLGLQLPERARNYVEYFFEHSFTCPSRLNLIDDSLIKAIERLDRCTKYVLQLRYARKLELKEIENGDLLNWHREEGEVALIIEQAKIALSQQLAENIKQKQERYITFWLKRYYENVISSVLLNTFSCFESNLKLILENYYGQKMTIEQIEKQQSYYKVGQSIKQAREELENALVQWAFDNFEIDLSAEREQIDEVVENWLNALYFREI
ncbi:MAG: hypothetical protein SW833_27590 [Cyanobacteriota bacterium]|nr:hypothetical protein [Cyanobacteriota bacterium]